MVLTEPRDRSDLSSDSHPADHRNYRLSAIDMVRGLAIVIMAIDHVRDFFLLAAEQDPMANPNITLGLFATRWITHFCAPVFVFLAGTSAGLMVARKTPSDLCKFLLTRGLWLIVVEVVLISTAVSFSPGGIEQLDLPARKRYDEFDFGYVLTVHKAQGSQWDDVVLFDESRAFSDNRNRWLYTGVTRAVKRLTVAV